MAFWSQNTTEPKQKHKFKITMTKLTGDSSIMWYAKSVNLPSYEISQGEYQLGNHKFKYPGILTWNDVTLTMVDPSSKTMEFLSLLKSTGYNIPSQGGESAIFSGPNGDTGISKESYDLGIQIQIINSDDGTPRETYELKNPFIKSMNLGDLSYDSEDLIEVQMVISYDFADITTQVSDFDPNI